MFGGGPEWVRSKEYGITTNSVGGEVALDFMFWPSAKRKFGWYLEPGYTYNFGRRHEQSIGISGRPTGGGTRAAPPKQARANMETGA
jgi:hypothetical protein